MATAGNVLMARLVAAEIDKRKKRKKLLDRYGEELQSKYLKCSNLHVLLVAGAGFEPAAFRL